jgi:hypothetical protein
VSMFSDLCESTAEALTWSAWEHLTARTLCAKVISHHQSDRVE